MRIDKLDRFSVSRSATEMIRVALRTSWRIAAFPVATTAALICLGCMGVAQPAFPLHTAGPNIVDSNGHRVRLNAVNWYGAESTDYVVGGLQAASLSSIAQEIKSLGFNAVRLPWSNELYESNPVVGNYALTANPSLLLGRSESKVDSPIFGQRSPSENKASQSETRAIGQHRFDLDWRGDTVMSIRPDSGNPAGVFTKLMGKQVTSFYNQQGPGQLYERSRWSAGLSVQQDRSCRDRAK